MSLSTLDKDHLLKFSTYIGGNFSIYNVRAKDGNIYPKARTSKSSSLYANLISDFGVIPNKTYILDNAIFLSNLQENYAHHFIRGFFDGDGCICIANNNARFSSVSFRIHNYGFLTDFKKYLIKNLKLSDVKTRVDKRGDKVNYELRWGGSGAVIKFYEYLYRDATICLNRKREKFEIILNRKKDYIDKLSSIYIGVSKNSYMKFISKISIGGKTKHLGIFDSDIDAAKAYDVEAKKIGRKTNF